jgi:hypothetical protein
VDFGLGSAVFLNSKYLVSRTDDMWWAGNWGSADVFKFTVNSSYGLTLVEVFGSEGCCDG